MASQYEAETINCVFCGSGAFKKNVDHHTYMNLLDITFQNLGQYRVSPSFMAIIITAFTFFLNVFFLRFWCISVGFYAHSTIRAFVRSSTHVG